MSQVLILEIPAIQRQRARLHLRRTQQEAHTGESLHLPPRSPLAPGLARHSSGGSKSAADMRRLPWYLRLYPPFLASVGWVAFGLCQWYHLTDLENRKLFHDMSLKYMLTAVPQLLAALLLLYYACTFSRTTSAFVHRLLLASWLHQAVATLLLASLAQSTFNASLSLCCSFPTLCPVDAASCGLDQVVACPETGEQQKHYNLYPRMMHCCATCAVSLALASVDVAHAVKDMDSRVRRAQFLSFQRHDPAYEASASVTC